jgi:hypothetical protein
VQALAPQLGDEQIRMALNQALGMIRGTRYFANYRLAELVEALASELSSEQAQTALNDSLAMIGETTDENRLRALVKAVEALKVSGEQAQAALTASS